MDAGTQTNSLIEESITRLREHREEMTVWLALEVLQLNPGALGDRELLDRLVACQERMEERLRDKAAGGPLNGEVTGVPLAKSAGPL